MLYFTGIYPGKTIFDNHNCFVAKVNFLSLQNVFYFLLNKNFLVVIPLIENNFINLLGFFPPRSTIDSNTGFNCS